MNIVSLSPPASDRRRWMALGVVCLAQLMIVLDTTIVNVALPSIQRDLHFTQGNLTWVVNAFLITFGSFLLLAGRLGDLFGRKRVFLSGVVVFTAASALCGLAPSQGWLIAARFIQGVGGALSASVILAIVVTEFPKPIDRARAMSAYVFVAVAGGSLGLLAGGALTQALNWHWIFFVNLPIGVATFVLGNSLIPADRGIGLADGVDWLGSVLVTVSLMTAVYAIVQATSHGWGSPQVLGFGALAIGLMGAFLAVESRVRNPIMPLRILRLRGLIGSSAVRALLVTGMYSTFFLGTLYLEHVLHYSALRTGLAFLPWTVTVGILSLGITARLIARFGSMRVLIPGLATVAIGLGLLSTAGIHTSFFPTIFFAYIAIGLGIGSSFTPLLTIAMADVPASDAGLGSGIINVSQQVAGALGLAVLGTIASNHSKALEAHGQALASSLVSGYHLAFAIGAASVLVAIVTALVVLRPLARRAAAGAASAAEPPRLIAAESDAMLERQAA
jgi:EmrB/QacA subfamily drug resistance transporter